MTVLNKYRDKIRYIVITVICLLTVIIAWQYKYREQCNYLNSNATWHVLLTMQAYDENPISTHKFLPIVSLEDELDKNIQWAEMVADEEGNYYYTSFSPAGFALPYFFVKIFHLPISESSLYLFNLVLCLTAILITTKLMIDLFAVKIQKEYIIILTTLLFAFQTEIMHGMGQVYWHHSLMQVLLPLQILCFVHFDEHKKWKVGFFILAVLMPYVEWTGFIANVGFALALFLKHGIRIQKKDFLWAFLTGVCTALALVLLCGHYLLVVDWDSFMMALRDRYMMRTKYAHATTFNLMWGYWKSFKALWEIFFLLAIGCVILNKGIKWVKEWIPMLPVLFVTLFPMLENLVMKEHAISYTYDRMKLVYPLLMMIFILLASISPKKKWFLKGTIVVTAVASAISVWQYTKNTERIWDASYRTDNEILAAYCRENYHEECLYGLNNAAVRGYANLLFDRGMYENISEDELLMLAEQRDAEYAVLLIAASEPDPANAWNMYAFSKAVVYDRKTNEKIEIKVENGRIETEWIE